MELLGTSRIKDGEEVAVIPRVPRKKKYTGIRRTSRKEDGRLGCSGRTTLRRRQCNGPLLHNERLLTLVISTVTNTENYPITRNS
jgi:hypothetical protein